MNTKSGGLSKADGSPMWVGSLLRVLLEQKSEKG